MMWLRTGQVTAGCPENGNDPSGYTKFDEFLYCLMNCSMQLASDSLHILQLTLFVPCHATLHCWQHRHTNVTKLWVQQSSTLRSNCKTQADNSSSVRRSVRAAKPTPRWFCFHLMDHDMDTNTGKRRTNVMWHP